MLATLIRLTGDIDRAEDALHDAVVAAADSWRRDGVPDRPGAWLTTVARNKALDRLRREARRAPKEAEAFRLLSDGSAMDDNDTDSRDDRLRLLFTCCHPALSPESQVALALRSICGLATVDIARVFLVPEPTIGQRISRAKAKIAKAHIPYRVPEEHELPDRLRPVLATVYAVFTAGHHAPIGELDARLDLADEAIRLARVLVELMPDEAECVGLLALTLATNARRMARTDPDGEIVLLADQDRSLWDAAAIAEAATLVDSVLRRGRPGAYQMQAAIACLHGTAATYAETIGHRSPNSSACSRSAGRRRWCGSIALSRLPRLQAQLPAWTCWPIWSEPPPSDGICTGPSARTSNVDSAGPKRPPTRTGKRSSAPATTPTVVSCSVVWPNSRQPELGAVRGLTRTTGQSLKALRCRRGVFLLRGRTRSVNGDGTFIS